MKKQNGGSRLADGGTQAVILPVVRQSRLYSVGCWCAGEGGWGQERNERSAASPSTILDHFILHVR